MDNTVQMFITIKGVSQCVKTSVRKIFYKSLLKMCAKTISITLHHDRKISLSRCYYILTYSPQRKLSRLSARLAPCSFVDCYFPARLKLLDNLSPSQLPRRRFAVTLNVDNFRGQIYRKASRMSAGQWIRAKLCILILLVISGTYVVRLGKYLINRHSL